MSVEINKMSMILPKVGSKLFLRTKQQGQLRKLSLHCEVEKLSLHCEVWFSSNYTCMPGGAREIGWGNGPYSVVRFQITHTHAVKLTVIIHDHQQVSRHLVCVIWNLTIEYGPLHLALL